MAEARPEPQRLGVLDADSPGPGRVLIALSAGPLVADPTWTRYDNLGSNVRCVGFDCQSGRQSEFDTTDTGTARVFFHDRNQTLNDDDLVGLQIMLQLYDPVAEVWQVTVARPHRRRDAQTNPSAPLSDTEFSCVDLFDYLGGCKFLPGVMGDAGGPVDMVFYEDGPVGSGMLPAASRSSWTTPGSTRTCTWSSPGTST